MYRPGDVVVADFPGVVGVKRRPAVVVSSDTYHAVRPDLILGLITSQTVAAIGPTDWALLDWAASGLRLPSAFRTFLATIPRVDIIAPVGRLSDRDWQGVQACLGRALAIPGGATPAGPSPTP